MGLPKFRKNKPTNKEYINVSLVCTQLNQGVREGIYDLFHPLENIKDIYDSTKEEIKEISGLAKEIIK